MYINLCNELKRMKIQKKELSEYMNKIPKWLSIRLSNNTRFSEDEIDVVFEFMQNKGSKKSKDYLFEYSKKIDNTNNDTPQIINSLMNRMGLTNEELAEIMEVTPQTVSAWRNNKNREMSESNLFKLSEVLDCTVSVLKGYSNVLDKEFKGDKYELMELQENACLHKMKNLVQKLIELKGYILKDESKKHSDILDLHLIGEIEEFVDLICATNDDYVEDGEKRKEYLAMKNYDFNKGVAFQKGIDKFKKEKFKDEDGEEKEIYIIDDLDKVKEFKELL